MFCHQRNVTTARFYGRTAEDGRNEGYVTKSKVSLICCIYLTTFISISMTEIRGSNLG